MRSEFMRAIGLVFFMGLGMQESAASNTLSCKPGDIEYIAPDDSAKYCCTPPSDTSGVCDFYRHSDGKKYCCYKPKA